ncbi:MAG: Ig-like domain-containing protein, partial [Flavobacteriales bacterium]
MYRSLLLLSSLFPCLLQAHTAASSTEIPSSAYVLDYASEFTEDQDSGGSLTLTTPGDWNTATARIENGDSTLTGSVVLSTGAPGEILWVYTHEPHHFGADGFSITVDDTNGQPHHVDIAFTQQATNDPMTVTFGGECTATALATMENQSYTLTPCILEEDGPALAFQLTASDELDGVGATPFSISQMPAHGGLTTVSAFDYTYDSDDNYYGPDTIKFEVTDASGFVIVLVIPFEIESVDDGPTTASAQPASATEQEAGQTTYVTRSVTFTDPDGLGTDDVQLVHADNAHLPSILDETVGGDGALTVSFSYAALDDFFGTDLIEFSIIDLEGNMTSLNVPIEVEGT